MKILCLLLVFFPSRLKIFFYNIFLGAEIDRTARIGFSFINAKKIKIGPHARIGHLNVINNVEMLEMGAYSIIGKLNHISGLPLSSSRHFSHEENRFPALVIGEHSAIVARHYFDCSNTVRLGKYSTVAGLGCAFFTHGLNIEVCRQESAPVLIGDYCMIGARCVFVKGSALPSCSVLAANSTLHKAFTETHMLYSGVPAQPVMALSRDAAYFSRSEGTVS